MTATLFPLIFRMFGVILFGVSQAVVQGFSTPVYPLDAAALPNCVCSCLLTLRFRKLAAMCL